MTPRTRHAAKPASRPETFSSIWREHRLPRNGSVVHDQGVPYVNTSVELWDPYGGAGRQAPDRANTLLEAHEPAAVDCQVERAGADGGATRIVPAIAPSPRSTSCAATTTGYNRASAS